MDSINMNKNTKPESIFKAERPVMSVVRFLTGGEYKNVGAVWDNGMASGGLTMRLDLSEIETDMPVVRLVVFPKESFQKNVIDSLLTELEHKIKQKLIAPEKPDPKLPPLFRCIIYSKITDESGAVISTDRLDVGALWPNYATGELELQLRLHAIPKNMLPAFSILLFPHRNRLKESGRAEGEPGMARLESNGEGVVCDLAS